jgi:O-antigen ligase
VNKQYLITNLHKSIIYTLIFFNLWALISLLNSDTYLIDGLFGLNNRNEGLISYLALSIFLISSMLVSSNNFISRVNKYIISMGIISLVYGLIQILGLDLFDYYNRYNQVITFFGNPNFQSSFLGITSVIVSAYFFSSMVSIRLRILMLLYIAMAMFVIFKSDSTQGFLIFLIGLSIVSLLWVGLNAKLHRFFSAYLFILVVSFVGLLLDILQLSPWKSFIYQSSVSYRGDFWRAAVQLIIDKPLFGVGMTGFRDNYRGYRDSVAIGRSEYNQIVESAHNRLLDLASSGGIILLLAYIALLFLVFKSAVKVLKRSKEFNPGFIAVFGSWIAYLAQAQISVFSFANEIIGWTLSGVIIGFEIVSRPTESKKNDAIRKISLAPMAIFAIFIQLVFFSTYIQSEFEFKAAIEKGEVNLITEKVQAWPKRNDRYYIVTQLFEKGGFPDRSLVIAQEAVSLWPNNFEAWMLLYLSPNVSKVEKEIALKNLRKLDPLNPLINQ